MQAKLLKIPYFGTLVLLAYMPFHIFLSQWLSAYTGGLEVWKVAKDVFTILLVLVSVGLVLTSGKYKKTPFRWFAAGAALYLGLHILLYCINKDTSFGVAALASVYNNRLLWYLGIGLSAALLTPEKISQPKLIKLVLIVSTITVAVGLLQYVLPKDVMSHFGYSLERGVKPAFFIDDKADLPRIMSTLRDPNSLGAYLILPILLLGQMVIKAKKDKRLLFGGLLGLHGLALFLTFSRAAWAGTAIGTGLIMWINYKKTLIDWIKKYWLIWAAVLILVVGGGYLARDQYVVQNIIFHSDETTQAELDSNALHGEFISRGAEGIISNPLGHGPGTAGIVSIQNPGGSLLTENYYLQIGYEAGVVGLALFIGLWLATIKRLQWSTQLATGLFATSLAYAVMALLMHLWTNEAVAAQWWLLSGLAMAPGFRNSHNKTDK